MLRVHQLRVSLDEKAALDEPALCRAVEKRLRLQRGDALSARVVKWSVDARDKGDVHFAATVDAALRTKELEARTAARLRPNEAALVEEKPAAPLPPFRRAKVRPVVVGMGPAGLFCAWQLAKRGDPPLLVERGKPVESRAEDVARFRQTGALLPHSNVLFGEGGAGAFSDGKLTCGLGSARIREVLEIFVSCGAPEEILVSQRPHIGTDVLRGVLQSMRRRLAEMGCDIRFETRLADIDVRDGALRAVTIENGFGARETLACERLFLAIGHSARDTYEMLKNRGVRMERKPFAVGVRIEHPQAMIDRAQYGRACGHPALPRAEYKLNAATPDGRGVYTFCMCPGGEVIGAISEDGGVNVNGMSLHARDGENANSAVLVGVRPEDYQHLAPDDPLSGVMLQRQIERAAFVAAGGGYRALCQRVDDFLLRRCSSALGEVRPSYRPGVTLGELDACLPPFVCQNLRLALPLLGKRLRGFDRPDAVLTGPETRSSSPVRLCRRENGQSENVVGLYPIGEGAGYAGGITSAALDGLNAADRGGTPA